MAIGYLEIEAHLPGVTSLKEKRVIVKSLKDRLRSRYNIAIAEIDEMDKWQKAFIGIVSIGNDKRKLNSSLDHILNSIEESRGIEIVKYNYEFF